MKIGKNTTILAPNLIVGDAISGIVDLLKLNKPTAIVGFDFKYKSGVW